MGGFISIAVAVPRAVSIYLVFDWHFAWTNAKDIHVSENK